MRISVSIAKTRVHRQPLFVQTVSAALLCICLVLTTQAQTSPPSQVELNGFLLGQYAKAPDGAFGKPTQETKTDDGWVYRVYVFDQKHRAYMAFKFPAGDLQRMTSIQIAGDPGTPMRPFLGLVLGDDKIKVQDALGDPNKVKTEKEYDVDLYTYAHRNYSVEIDRQGRVSSIQIMDYEGFAERPASAFPDVDTFRKFVTDKDVDGLLTVLAGDIEIYKDKYAYSFTRSARDELSSQDSKIWGLLFGEKDSLRTAFTEEKFKPDAQIRVYEKAPPGSVVKFEHSKIVREVVYKMEAGAWKVWEIQLH